MDVVGIHVVLSPQNWRAFFQTTARRATHAVGRVNTGNAQNTAAYTGGSAQEAHRVFGINSAPGPWCVWVSCSIFCSKGTLAVTVDAAGGTIHQATRRAAPAQRPGQSQRARVFPALARRRRQVQHAVGQAGQTLQACRIVQVAQQWYDAARAQIGRAVGTGGQGQYAHPIGQGLRYSQTNIAAANDQQALTAKTRGQCAGPRGVQTTVGV